MGVEIAIPAYNEEMVLEKSISKLVSFLKNVDFEYNITIVDAGSKDSTLDVAKGLADNYGIKVIHLNHNGKGNAIQKAWIESKNELLCFMDADMSTDLSHLSTMVKLLEKYDVVSGNRLSKKARVKRKLSRTFLSMFYNVLVKSYLNVKVNDIQCGFKGIRRKVFLELVNDARNDGFFFDTELMVFAEKKGYRIKEIPIKWREGGDSKVNVFRTSLDYLKQIYKLKKRLKK